MKYIASCSFGKDSLAMILKLLELNYPLDEVVYFDMGAEFESINKNKQRIKKELGEREIQFTELKPKQEFFYMMLEKEVHKRDGTTQHGYKWCGGLCRWGMTEKDCLKYCYKKGFNWEENGIELYSILDCVSCWCCRNKNLKELENMYLFLPDYWKKLEELQSKIDIPFKDKYSIFDLKEKFRKKNELFVEK